jgi:hypothetical protein
MKIFLAESSDPFKTLPDPVKDSMSLLTPNRAAIRGKKIRIELMQAPLSCTKPPIPGIINGRSLELILAKTGTGEIMGHTFLLGAPGIPAVYTRERRHQ